MSYENIINGNFGWVAKVTFYEVDEDGVWTAKDISDYTTKQLLFVDPDDASTTKTALFHTDGTDGILRYVTISGDIDQAGEWQVFGRILKTGASITSEPVSFTVGDSPD
jgi:hypothetical protein